MLNKSVKGARKVIISGDNLTSFKLAKSLDRTIPNIIWTCPDYDYGQWAANQLDEVVVLHGDSTEISLLKEIHVEKADFFIGSGKNTEHNVLAALLAKSQGVTETISISDQPQKSNQLFKSIGIDQVINPRLTTATFIMDLVHHGRILSEIRIEDSDLEAVRIVAGDRSKVCGRPLYKAWKPLAQKAIAGAIIRDKELIIPKGDSIIQPQDQVLVITRTKTLDNLKRMFRERR